MKFECLLFVIAYRYLVWSIWCGHAASSECCGYSWQCISCAATQLSSVLDSWSLHCDCRCNRFILFCFFIRFHFQQVIFQRLVWLDVLFSEFSWDNITYDQNSSSKCSIALPVEVSCIFRHLVWVAYDLLVDIYCSMEYVIKNSPFIHQFQLNILVWLVSDCFCHE